MILTQYYQLLSNWILSKFDNRWSHFSVLLLFRKHKIIFVYWLKKGRQNCNTRIVINFEVCINVNFLNQLNQKNTHRFSRTFKFQSLCKQKLPILDMFSQNFIFLLWFLWQLFTFPNCQIDIKSQPSYSLQMLGKMKYVNRKNLYF